MIADAHRTNTLILQFLPGAAMRFLMAMGSLTLVDLAITGLLVYLSDLDIDLLTGAMLNLAVFGVVNLAGCLVIGRILFGHRLFVSERQLAQFLTNLPMLMTMWTLCLTLLYMLLIFEIEIFWPQDTPLPVPAPLPQIAIPVWYTLVYMLLYGFYAWFVVEDFCQGLKLRIAKAGVFLAPGRGKLSFKLAISLAITALLPLVMMVVDTVFFAEFRQQQGLDQSSVILLNAAACLFLLCITLVFVVRAFTRPLEALAGNMRDMRDSETGAPAPVISNDEIGALARQFNRLKQITRERHILRQTIGQYLPESVAQDLMGNEGTLDPKSGIASILYADIADFTQLTDRYPAERMMEMLNDYFTAMLEQIRRHNGTVTQFQGDAILAAFNMPVPIDNHCDAAISTAIDMLDIVSKNQFANIPLSIRIGVATGPVLTGCVGGARRKNFSIYGNAVNLAARLEKRNKHEGTSLLIDQSTVNGLSISPPLAKLGPRDFQGLDRRIDIYCLTRENDALRQES